MGWQVGDLALCVDRGLRRCRCGCIQTGLECPPQGSVREVISIGECGDYPPAGCKEIALVFIGHFGMATRFRKITPGANIEGVEERRRLPVKQDA